MRKGPDGYWYVLGGNNSGIDQRHVTRPNSPIKKPTAGALLRLPPDCKTCEVIADGFRNPYDFDFNADGEIFTYDSDVEADFFLPWYQPTRLFHVGYGGNHGWQVTGQGPGWGRPDYYLDTVDILYPIGRGSPTGVTCYRHDQFPEALSRRPFRLRLDVRPRLLLSAHAERGDVQDEAGSLLGGDRLQRLRSDGHRRGAGRIAFRQHGRTQDARRRLSRRIRRRRQDAAAGCRKTDLDKVLRAPQPLDAWSRAEWEPLARKLGAEAVPGSGRRREENGRGPRAGRRSADGAISRSAAGKRRRTREDGPARACERAIAWSMGRNFDPQCQDLLQELGKDVRLRAFVSRPLSALADHVADLKVAGLENVRSENLGAGDKRVRQAAARLASLLPDERVGVNVKPSQRLYRSCLSRFYASVGRAVAPSRGRNPRRRTCATTRLTV